MRKLEEVREAKDLMTEAMEWSSFKWLFEKTRVRQTADRANEALDRLNRGVKAKWSAEAKVSYKQLAARSKAQHAVEAEGLEPDQMIGEVHEADIAAERARQAAEELFDKAERQMNLDLAREGCKKAIHSWELHEKAIKKAEAVAEENKGD
ncbi:MAG TPA: hypothetical protein VMU53_14900 [Candidatus Sulfotelmatobacter sp.]|nr:hypothetical protein [Candidatus Sulfotelmatobacter sp.]